MNPKSRIVLWGPFVAAVLLSWIVGETARSTRLYYLLLDLLGILIVILAVRVLVHTGLKLWPILGVIAGLVIGQFRFIVREAVFLLWKIGGFAP